MGQPDQRRLSATAKIRRVGWDENLVFCSRDYSLLKSMKRSFVCTWHSPNTLPTMVHSQAFHAIIWQSPIERPHLSTARGSAE